MSDEKVKRPTECSIEYVSGREGYYVKKTNPLFSAVVKVATHPEMDPVVEELTYHGKRIPGNVFRQWQRFGAMVSAKSRDRSEAGLILFYHPTKCEWGAYPPKQDLSVVSVDFSGVTECMKMFREEHGKEWLMAGTLHTHPGDAGPSQTDVEDEKKLDGIHLIVPDFGRQKDLGVNCHVVCSGVRFIVRKPIGFLINWESGLSEEPLEVPEVWFDQIKFGRGTPKGGYSVGEGYMRGYGGEYATSYSGSHTFKGEGPSMHSATVNGVDLNLMGKLFDDRELKAVLKRLKFSKNERKFLLHNFENDLEDILTAFDKSREALKFAKEIKGTVSEHELGEIVEKVGHSAREILDSFVSIANRMLEQAGEKSPEKAPEEGKEEEEEGKPEIDEKSSSAEKSQDIVKAPEHEFDHREF